jgi:hypothetical protein
MANLDMPAQPPTVVVGLRPARPRRWLTWMGLLLGIPALVLIVALVGLLIWKSGWQREVDRQLAELRAAGVPTTPEELEAAYRLPEGAEDCTQLWLDATAPIQTAAKEWPDSGLPLLTTDGPDAPRFANAWPLEERAQDLLERFGPQLTQLHEVARRGGAARYPTHFAAGYDMPMDYLSNVREACRLLLLQSYARGRAGDVPGALESIGTMRRLSDSLSDQPASISLLVRIGVDLSASEFLEQFVEELPLNDSQLAALQANLIRTDYERHFVRALQGERVFALIAFDRPELAVEELGDKISRVLQFTKSYDQDFLLDALSEYEQAATRGPAHAVSHAERLANRIVDEGRVPVVRLRISMSAMTLPGLVSLANYVARQCASRDAAICGLAAERYRLRHGAWPAALSDLTPDLLPQSWADGIPVDPFDGQPLRYLVDDDELRVYSIGMNGRDDGGRDDPRDGDIVFHIRPAPDR